MRNGLAPIKLLKYQKQSVLRYKNLTIIKIKLIIYIRFNNIFFQVYINKYEPGRAVFGASITGPRSNLRDCNIIRHTLA